MCSQGDGVVVVVCMCVCLFIHSFIHLFIHSFIHLFIHSFIHLFIHLFIHSFIYSFIHAFPRTAIFVMTPSETSDDETETEDFFSENEDLEELTAEVNPESLISNLQGYG